MATFSVPPGYHVELVAAEPMVDSPILMDFDADGRMWVVEMPGFLPDESGQDSKEPIDRVVVLEDTNDDGKMDKRTIFADKLRCAARHQGARQTACLIGIPPTSGTCATPTATSRPTRREKVVDTYGRGGNVEHDANSLLWAMDNIMYSSEHTWDLEWKNGKFESLPTISKGPVADLAGRFRPRLQEHQRLRRCLSTSRRRGTSCATRTTRAPAVSTSR